MSTQIVENFSGVLSPYETSYEYIIDILKRLDLQIEVELHKQRARRIQEPFDALKGLVISDEEIETLLADDEDQNNDPLIQALYYKIQTLTATINQRVEISRKSGKTPLLVRLGDLFKLTPFEIACIIICLAPEVNVKYEKLYAYLQDDVTRKNPTINLVLNLSCKDDFEKLAARIYFKPSSKLCKYFLHLYDYSSNNSSPLISKYLKLDRRITDFLLDIPYTDPAFNEVAVFIFPSDRINYLKLSGSVGEQMFSLMGTLLQEEIVSERSLIIHFFGPQGSGKRALVQALCNELQKPLIIVDTLKLIKGQHPLEYLLNIIEREVILQRAEICFDHFDILIKNDEMDSQAGRLLELIKRSGRIGFVLSRYPWKRQVYSDEFLIISKMLEIPKSNDSENFWKYFSKEYKIDPKTNFSDFANKFKFTPGQIKSILSEAYNISYQKGSKSIVPKDIYTACRMQSKSKLGKFAHKVEPIYKWEDIVLPQDQMLQLREICNHVKHRSLVYEKWGFDKKFTRGKGLNALFSGPPGTGKTMAAEVIANELNLELYKIDLSQIVSKYIGETEKNLHEIFTEAVTSNAILFFDEADALFGKRSVVKDAHDRYANIETAYLLQKMEEYSGISILATNFSSNMDEAFTRRISFSVEFPSPDEYHRRLIWNALIPEALPKSEDLDLEFLANQFKITGGNIKNIILAAAFLAAEDSSPVAMKHLVRATRREFHKMGRLCMSDDFGKYGGEL